MKQAMPFTATEHQNGIVAYNAENHDTLGVLVAQEWTHTTCIVHWVILNKFILRHGFLEEIANWLFTTAFRTKIYAPVNSDNEASLSVCEKLGFKEKTVLEDAYDDGVDIVLMELKREDCPYWTQPELGKVANG